MVGIDWEKLGDLEDWNHGWRATLDSGLSERYVPGEGENPRVLLVGEAPGAQEDSALRPFVGAAGRVLRDLMASVGLFTGETPHFGVPNCWLTNLVHFRPPRNRNPTPEEIFVARSGLREEWMAVGCPRIIIPLGGIALNAIMKNHDPGKKGTFHKLSILKMAGKCIKQTSREGQSHFVWPMIHPSFGVRWKSMIPLIEKDWDRLDSWLKRTGMLKGDGSGK
jgi:uracil-DNA glycosylase family 4